MVRRQNKKMTTRNFRRDNFGLLRDLCGRITWEQTVKGRGILESWLILKDYFFQA